jgi:hypothetical protein
MAIDESILMTVDEKLAGKELMDQARALLLLRMCQFTLLYAPEKAERYWEMLQGYQRKLPAENQEEMTALSSTLDEALSSDKKGFTGEMLAEVQAATDLIGSDLEAAKQRLKESEEKLKKRFLPFGKGPVWNALVEAWLPIDRAYALELLGNVSGGLQENYIIRINKAKPLSTDEWMILVDSVKMGKIEGAALKILDDTDQQLQLPDKPLRQVAMKIRNSLPQQAAQIDEAATVQKLIKYGRLLGLHSESDQAELIPSLLEELYLNLAKAPWLDQSWMSRFNLLQAVIQIGVNLNVSGQPVMTPEYVSKLAKKGPKHLVNFLWSQWAAATTSSEDVQSSYATMMEMTKQDETAEAWFLVTLVKNGMGGEAYALAEGSPSAATLLPRIRRAWLCNQPEEARSKVSPEDMADDPIGEFLAQGGVKQRSAYLKNVTQNGSRSVPGAMWAGAGTEEEEDGLRGFWSKVASRQKTLDEAISEYLEHNPVYSSYRRDTKKEDQFSAVLRVHGYGDHRFQDMDAAMLAALVSWGDEAQAEVQSVLRKMWEAIRPDDQILMLDWLRNAIMSRCVNVFGADPEVLIGDYLGWFKRELVDKGRQWQIGKQIMTLKYPGTSLLQFCLSSASTVNAFSPARRDQILLTALERFEANQQLIEVAAQLYNSDKEPLALEPPVKLGSELVEAWQVGIVKNTLERIIKALAAQTIKRAAAQAEAAPQTGG